MKGKIKPHPSFLFAGVRTFTSLEELLNIEWVDFFRRSPNFYQYSIDKDATNYGFEYTLLAEYNDGYNWWIIGFIDEYELIKELPEIQFKKRG